MKRILPHKSWHILVPVLGIFLYCLLYVAATMLYPGGSQADKLSVGFSWTNNYWCNLLDDTAINGQPNTSKSVALAGMGVLCISLSLFWVLFPLYINLNKRTTIIIQCSGIVSMAIALFLFAKNHHDLLINLASVFGLIAMTGTFIGLYKTKRKLLFAFGLLNILLVGLNNYVYYNNGLIVLLPIIQKISFASFLIWFAGICISLYIESQSQKEKIKQIQ